MHYIRLVVLGDSQVGKTSLIRQLVGQEHKFEPELRLAAKLELERKRLDAEWLSVLNKHEQQLEKSIETKRLASLLSSQIELQQLLLQQQRSCNSNGPSSSNSQQQQQQRQSLTDRKQQQQKPRKSLPIESSAATSGLTSNKTSSQTGTKNLPNLKVESSQQLKNDAQEKQQQQQQQSLLSQPTILISVEPSISSLSQKNQSATVANAAELSGSLLEQQKVEHKTGAAADSGLVSGSNSGRKEKEAEEVGTDEMIVGQTCEYNNEQAENAPTNELEPELQAGGSSLSRAPISGSNSTSTTVPRAAATNGAACQTEESKRAPQSSVSLGGSFNRKEENNSKRENFTAQSGSDCRQLTNEISSGFKKSKNTTNPSMRGAKEGTISNGITTNTPLLESTNSHSTLQNANHVPTSSSQTRAKDALEESSSSLEQRQLLSSFSKEAESSGSIKNSFPSSTLGHLEDDECRRLTSEQTNSYYIMAEGAATSGSREPEVASSGKSIEQNSNNSCLKSASAFSNKISTAPSVGDNLTSGGGGGGGNGSKPLQQNNEQQQQPTFTAHQKTASSKLSTVGAFKQKSLEVGVSGTISTLTAAADDADGNSNKTGQESMLNHHRNHTQHRHSYCAPSQQIAAAANNNNAKSTGSNKVQQSVNNIGGKQQGELSTQAKIINILFTRNEPKDSTSGSTSGSTQAHPVNSSQQQSCDQPSGGSQKEEEKANHHHQQQQQQPQPQKSSRPMLMPSLLRQYQRRLSNFHQTVNTAASSSSGNNDQQQSVGGHELRKLANEEEEERRNQAFLSVADENRKRERTKAAAQAAANLATAAASAAQALLAQKQTALFGVNEEAEGEEVEEDEAGERETDAHADSLLFDAFHGHSSTHMDFTLTAAGINQTQQGINLYSLTAEYKRKLSTYERKLNSTPPLATSNQQPSSLTHLQHRIPISHYKHQIKHFNVNYINNRSLYEINIVDMPTIEPKAFPTSSLIEWSLYKGESHLLTADAYLLVFDLTRPKTIEYIKMLRDKIFESREMSHVPVYVIANKADLCPTLQPSLQARRLRNVANRRHQAAANSNSAPGGGNGSAPSGGGAANTSSSGMVNIKGSGPAPVGPAHAQIWAPPTLNNTSDHANRSMPAAAAHQLMAAYKFHRMRLGSSGPIVSLRRWAKLRKAIVATGGDGGPMMMNPGISSSSQWLQFERSRMHYNLIIGASGGDSLGNNWSSSLGKALNRLKSYVNNGFKRLSLRRRRRKRSNFLAHHHPSEHRSLMGGGNKHRRRSMAAAVAVSVGSSSGGAGAGSKLAQTRHSVQRARGGRAHPRRRRGRRRRRRPDDRGNVRAAEVAVTTAPASNLNTNNSAFAFSRWFPGHSRNSSSQQQQQRTDTPTHVPTSSEQTVSDKRRTKFKRKRADQSDSGGSKSDSLRSQVGSKRKLNTHFRYYSKFLTSSTAAKSSSSPPTNLHSTFSPTGCLDQSTSGGNSKSPPALAALEPTSTGGQLEVQYRRKVEPVCGSMSTMASRQSFYDLFNRLLQTSSTTAAKTQLKLSSGGGGGGNGSSNSTENSTGEEDSSKVKNVGGEQANGSIVMGGTRQISRSNAPTPLLQVDPVVSNDERRCSSANLSSGGGGSGGGGAGSGKKESRRKSSSTGAALWQTLSNYALSRTSRGSICAQQDNSGNNNNCHRRESTNAQLGGGGGGGAKESTASVAINVADGQRRRNTSTSGQNQLLPTAGAGNGASGCLANDGLHLGAEQYLSVDMLRKLSLVSAHSQMSVPIAEDDGILEDQVDQQQQQSADDSAQQRSKSSLSATGRSADSPESSTGAGGGGALVSMAKRVSKGNLRLWNHQPTQNQQQGDTPDQETTTNTNQSAINGDRASSATPSGGPSRTKRIWYRGMVKRILFQSSSKPSFRNIVTALELQKKAEALSQEQQQTLDSPEDVQSPSSIPAAAAAAAAADESAENNTKKQEEGEKKTLPSAASVSGEKAEVGGGSGCKQTKQSLTVIQSAPSIRIITSGSSMSLLSATNTSGATNGSSKQSTDSENFDHQPNKRELNHNELQKQEKQQQQQQLVITTSSPTLDSNCERKGCQDDATTTSLPSPPSFMATTNKEADSKANQLSGSGQTQTSSAAAAAAAASAASDAAVSEQQVAMSISPSVSLSSLSDSVSLTLEHSNNTGETNQEANCSSSLTTALPALDSEVVTKTGDSITPTATENNNEPIDAEAITKKPLTFTEATTKTALQPQPQIVGSMRKLSADDCLIINRQRRKSLASVERSKNGTGTGNDDDDDDDSWLLVGRDQTQSACGTYANHQARLQADISGTGSGNAMDGMQGGGGSDSRRQSIKASIENAIHLLVPRAKGSRSASITLGATDCEQRSRSQLGSIMGAVNVHKTWRDWRQLLGKKKSNNISSTLIGHNDSGSGGRDGKLTGNGNGKTGAGDNGNGNDNNNSSSILAASPILGFLSSHSAFTKLSSEQQREAAINFDQLMRINQLTLSAANVVIMANNEQQSGTTAHSNSGLQTTSGATSGGVGDNSSNNNNNNSSSSGKQQGTATGFGTGTRDSLMFDQTSSTNVNSSANVMSGGGTGSGILTTCSNTTSGGGGELRNQAQRRGGKQHKPLITRLQSGGNLLLKRSSTKRRMKAKAHAYDYPIELSSLSAGSSSLATTSGRSLLQQSTNSDNLLLLTCNNNSTNNKDDSDQQTNQNHQEKTSGSNSTKSNLIERVTASLHGNQQNNNNNVDHNEDSTTKLTTDSSGMSAQIASAAASALERQKRRCEELSFILEPRFDKKQPGAQYPLFVSHDLNPILKDLAQLVRKHWKCNYVECSAASNWNIKPIISELTRTLECNQLLRDGQDKQQQQQQDDEDLSDEGSSLSTSYTGTSSDGDFDNDDDDYTDDDGIESGGDLNGHSDDDDDDDIDFRRSMQSDLDAIAVERSDPEASDSAASGLQKNPHIRTRHNSDSSLGSTIVMRRPPKLSRLRTKRADSLGGMMGSEARSLAARLFESGRRKTELRRPSVQQQQQVTLDSSKFQPTNDLAKGKNRLSTILRAQTTESMENKTAGYQDKTPISRKVSPPQTTATSVGFTSTGSEQLPTSGVSIIATKSTKRKRRGSRVQQQQQQQQTQCSIM